jgi:flavodoxin
MKTKLFLLTIMIMSISSIDLQAQASSASNKILVAYFSHSGNTRVIAQQIREATGGYIFEIQPVKDYPDDYQTVVEQAKKEINSNYKPALKTKVKNIESYDVIFIGSPCWWGTIAPPVATFLSSYNLQGKTIIPFMTHEGSRMGHSVSDIKKLCPKSTILEGLPINGSYVKSAHNDVMKWLREIKMIN